MADAGPHEGRLLAEPEDSEPPRCPQVAQVAAAQAAGGALPLEQAVASAREDAPDVP